MDAIGNWDALRGYFNGRIRCVFASVGEDGVPHITPIGSLFLTEPGKGFYLEKYPSAMPRDFAGNAAICIYGSRLTTLGFARALITGKMADAPGYRLYGRAGERREATPDEMAAFAERTRLFRRLRGAGMLWNGMRHARDVFIERADGLNLGVLSYKEGNKA